MTARAAACALLLGMPLLLAAQTVPPKFIPTFLIYYGGGPALVDSDAAKLAKFDLINIDRFRYNSIGSNTWTAIKAINPGSQIYLYEMGPEAPSHLDSEDPVLLSGLGRHNVSRGHPQGSLNIGNPGIFQLDAAGNRIYSAGSSNASANQYWYLMDFNSGAYQNYWATAVMADIVDQPWRADGVFADNCLAIPNAGGYNTPSQWYSTNATWSAAMNAFASGIATAMHGYNQKLWCNRGQSRTVDGSLAWQALDNGGSPPDVLLEEGVFAVEWGAAAVQFYPESEWKRQVDTLGAIRNSKVAMMSHTKLLDGQSGLDNWGRPVSYRQILWYSLGSFLLSKNDVLGNAYFMFSGGSGYNRIWWYDEYDRIDLGRALGAYSVTTIGSANIYWREFEKGYVYVNPSNVDIPSVTLPQACRQLTRTNLFSAPDSIPIVNSIALPGHTAAILLKVVATPPSPPAQDTLAPSLPTGLAGTAVSASQINLTWTASTDNVGVKGYIVYLNDVQLGTSTGTSFQHTGLAALTTYRYRVSAFDAVPNHSAWTATPVAVTTPAPDIVAPSVPTGLAGTATSATQINLSWNASTDNVGVKGYTVYLNDAPLGTTSATSFQHAGLAALTTYRYRVSAFDAVPNHSAWTATPVAVTTPLPDTVAPSVPTGLTATAVSATQANLSWTASTDNVGVIGYYVYVNNVALGTTTTTSFLHPGLTAGTTYSYRVSAYDAVPNHSAWSATPVAVTAVLPDTIAPSIPTGLKAAALSATQVYLSWNVSTDNVGVKGYKLYLNDVLLGTTAATFFQHTGLAALTTYSYRVSAYDAVPNQSAWTATPVSVKTPAASGDSIPPSVPAGLGGTAESSTVINLNWSASTDNVGVKGYYVFLNDATLAITTQTWFRHSGRKPGTTYNYRVSAYDAVVNKSAWTTPPLAVKTMGTAPLDATPPSVPSGLRGTAISPNQVNLVWNPSTDNVGVKGYIVYLNDVQLGTATGTTFQHASLAALTTYRYRVSAYDAVPNHSAWTATAVAVKTPATPNGSQPPTVPTGLKGTAASATRIDLTWNASTDDVGVKGYYLYVNDLPLATTTLTSFQHTGLTALGTYNYRVSAFDAVPNHSIWTAPPISVRTLAASGDTLRPSVPTGLQATTPSSTVVDLRWNPATDNVGVTGYIVYVDDLQVGTTTTTTFQQIGRTPGTTYKYRVSAFDAVPNHSAWTATAVSVTTPSSAPAALASTAQFVATFPTAGLFRTGTGDGVSNDGVWWVEQKAGTTRTSVVGIGREGGTALRLHTEPGDNNVSGSGLHERNDMALPQATTDGYQGREHWWAHSVLFPADYVTPPPGSWGTVFDFHDSRNQGGQANFHIFTGSDGLIVFRGHAGPTVVMDGAGNEFSYGAVVGPVVKDTWYDFVYHVKWSSGSDGIFQAWVNGVLKLDHRGPTLYQGYGVYLKLANYHSAFGQSSSVIHDRVVRGPTALSVAPGPLEGVLIWSNGVLTALPP